MKYSTYFRILNVFVQKDRLNILISTAFVTFANFPKKFAKCRKKSKILVPEKYKVP